MKTFRNVSLSIKRLLATTIILGLISGPGAGVLHAQNYDVIGQVTKINLPQKKIAVNGKSFQLVRNVIVQERNRRGEKQPIVKIGDQVGLAFAARPNNTRVQVIWLLSGSGSSR